MNNKPAGPRFTPSEVATITTASAGAQLAVSTKPFTQGAVSGVKFTRNKVTLKDTGVTQGDRFYVYVLSSNNREGKIYTVNVETVNLDLKTFDLTSQSDKSPARPQRTRASCPT